MGHLAIHFHGVLIQQLSWQHSPAKMFPASAACNAAWGSSPITRYQDHSLRQPNDYANQKKRLLSTFVWYCSTHSCVCGGFLRTPIKPVTWQPPHSTCSLVYPRYNLKRPIAARGVQTKETNTESSTVCPEPLY